MWQFIKKYWCELLLAIIVFVFIFPGAINALFLLGHYLEIPYNIAWSAGETLLFYGSIIGALATIIAVVATIMYTKQSQKTERELNTKAQDEQRKFSLELLKKQLIFDRLNNSMDIIIEQLRNITLSLDPALFLEVGLNMNLNNYTEKTKSLQSMSFDRISKINNIYLFIPEEFTDNTTNDFVHDLHAFREKLHCFVTQMCVISTQFSNYEIQKNKNEIYINMCRQSTCSPIDPIRLENQRLKYRELDDGALNSIIDQLTPELEKLIAIKNNEYPLLISKTKFIIEHLRNKFDDKLNEEEPSNE